ncbi:MAG: hypothetical protein J0L88_13555, partial [Xanthomonadales bacterium]|nr:hypothetical protein [Xanthomonadales bacterium]
MTRSAAEYRRPHPRTVSGPWRFVCAWLLAAPLAVQAAEVDPFPHATAAIGAQRLVVAAAASLDAPRFVADALAPPASGL